MPEQMVKAEDAIWRRIGDEVVIIRDDGLSVHVLNPTAAIIWESYCGGKTADDIAAMLCERFEVTSAEASTDVADMIRAFSEKGFIRQSPEAVGR